MTIRMLKWRPRWRAKTLPELLFDYPSEMNTRGYHWRDGSSEYQLEVAWVPGTQNRPYPFGRLPNVRPIEVQGFHLATTPVTQALWLHVMGSNPAERLDLRGPVESVEEARSAGPGGADSQLQTRVISS